MEREDYTVGLIEKTTHFELNGWLKELCFTNMIFTGSGFASAENDIYSGRTSESSGIHIKHALKNKIKTFLLCQGLE